MVISTTFIPFLLIHYIFLKGGKILYIYTKKTMLILNMSFTKKIMEKKKKSSRYHSCSNVWNNKDSYEFLIRLLDIFVKFLLYMCKFWKNI